jgi:hypothetical protein
MAHAYTPGLRVAKRTQISKRRILPIPGEVLVKKGEEVVSSRIIAKTDLPGKVYTVNVVNQLGITPSEIREYMLIREGDTASKDEVIAENRPMISWFKTQVRSPINGFIENISNVTGQVLLREPPRPLNLTAYIDGQITEIIEGQGAIVETICSFIQGIFGVGGETSGIIEMAVKDPGEVLAGEMIDTGFKDRIIVGGSFVDWEAIKKARDAGVKGIIVGGIHDKDLKGLLGYDLGVAITGREEIGLTLIITEGFGKIRMASRTFDLLSEKAGQKASISGATQIRAGVIRPEIIIPHDKKSPGGLQTIVDHKEEQAGLSAGDPVRIIRVPYFGLIGKIASLPHELQVIETGSKVRVLEVELPDGSRVTIPRANVEIIEG